MKGITIAIIIVIAAALFSTSIISMSLVQAQNKTQTQLQSPQLSQGNQTGNSSYQIGPGALVYPSYKPCKEDPAVLCSFYPKPQMPPPSNMTPPIVPQFPLSPNSTK